MCREHGVLAFQLLTSICVEVPVCEHMCVSTCLPLGTADGKASALGSSDGKAFAYNAGGLGSIPGSGRSSGEGNGNPLQYSCLENPMDGGA